MDKRNYPLRKIIERDISVIMNDKTGLYEEGIKQPPLIFANRLECGHLVRPAKDFYGEIHAEFKQRCRYCHNTQTKQENE